MRVSNVSCWIIRSSSTDRCVSGGNSTDSGVASPLAAVAAEPGAESAPMAAPVVPSTPAVAPLPSAVSADSTGAACGWVMSRSLTWFFTRARDRACASLKWAWTSAVGPLAHRMLCPPGRSSTQARRPRLARAARRGFTSSSAMNWLALRMNWCRLIRSSRVVRNTSRARRWPRGSQANFRMRLSHRLNRRRPSTTARRRSGMPMYAVRAWPMCLRVSPVLAFARAAIAASSLVVRMYSAWLQNEEGSASCDESRGPVAPASSLALAPAVLSASSGKSASSLSRESGEVNARASTVVARWTSSRARNRSRASVWVV